jgi:hypothetical protein
MAHQAVALDPHFAEDGIVVAIGCGIDETQAIATGLAFGPQFVAGATVEGYVPSLKRLVERLLVHEANHENFAIIGILNDCRGESPHFLEIDLHCPVPLLAGLSGAITLNGQKQKTRWVRSRQRASAWMIAFL